VARVNNYETKRYEVDFAGKPLILETGKLANLASGSITATYGETVVLATVVAAAEAREGVDFFPLLVDYEERFYAAGKISGSRFIKREGRPSDAAILAARKIDRPIRPLFPKSYRKDVQVVVTVLSYDGVNDPDIISIIAASCALMQVQLPYKGPIAAMNVGVVDGELKLNPTEDELEKSKLNLCIAGNGERVMMLETEANEVSEEEIIKGIEMALAAMKPVVEIQKKIAEDKKQGVEIMEGETTGPDLSIAVKAEVHNYVADKLRAAIRELDKEQREKQIKAYEQEILQTFEGTYKQVDLKSAFAKLVHEEVRDHILNQGLRPDGRGMDEIRPLYIEVGLLPRTHGSALFARGETQALTVATLASPGMEQLIDTMGEETTKRFMHHYNFPPYSVGEVSPIRGASRREIGHGYLAEKALKPMIPSVDDFPYTIRLVSEIMSSNGSTSMAATSGSTLALMDAGVPIKKPVAGIAMGLVANEDASEYKILTDLQGLEDFAGDMDFKVAGTDMGITAVQMDTKIEGLTMDIVRDTFAKAKTARLEILEAMLSVIAKSRDSLSKYAPRIEAVKVNPDKIGEIIGPGGKTIKKIIEECGGKEITGIDIEDDGTVMVSSTDPEMGDKAVSIIKNMTREIVPGEIITGEVIEIKKDRMTGKEIGAIVAITPRQDGMIHISQIAEQRIERVSDVIKVGDTVTAKVVEVDPEKGRISLSMKMLNNHPQRK
jgi:polyribonucleotide nucleotidyltransferase